MRRHREPIDARAKNNYGPTGYNRSYPVTNIRERDTLIDAVHNSNMDANLRSILLTLIDKVYS